MSLARPLPDDTREALKALWDICEDQQAELDRHRDAVNRVWHVEPFRPREGQLVFADGTDWNPGGGAGYYERVGGAWNKL